MAKAALEITGSVALRDGTGDMGYEVWGVDEDTGVRIGSRHKTNVRLPAAEVVSILDKPDKYAKELQKLLTTLLPLSWSKDAIDAAITGDEDAAAAKAAEGEMQEANLGAAFPLIVGL